MKLLCTIVIFVALLAALAFVSALAIEWLAIRRLHRARDKQEIAMWQGIQKRLAILAAPAGSVLMLSGLYTIVGFSRWEGKPLAWAVIAFASFLAVVIISSTWVPKRFAAVALRLASGEKIGEVDSVLRITWAARIAVLVGIAALVVFMPPFAVSLAIIVGATIIGSVLGALAAR